MRRLAFFRRFTDVELWEAVRVGRCQKYAAGEVLIQEGEEDDHIFIVATGLLKVTQRGKLLNVVSPGECVGEMAYARRGSTPRSATVTAVEPSWTLSLRVADIERFSESCRARFTEVFLSIMADRISMLGGRLLSVLQEQKIGLV
jgi:CRP-like cAMP-binding protein